jgi:hypothetical protein
VLEELPAQRLGEHRQDAVVGEEEVVGIAQFALLLVVLEARAQLGEREHLVHTGLELSGGCEALLREGEGGRGGGQTTARETERDRGFGAEWFLIECGLWIGDG